jgi:hypothetical protein
MKPKQLPPISHEAFERFEAQDKKTLSPEEKGFLKECVRIYSKNPIKF